MTEKKTATKKAPAKKAEKPAEEVTDLKTVEEAAAPEMEGEAYQVGYVGVSSDDEDHSFAAQAARLNEA